MLISPQTVPQIFYKKILLLLSTSFLPICHTTQTLLLLIRGHRGMLAYQALFIVSICLLWQDMVLQIQHNGYRGQLFCFQRILCVLLSISECIKFNMYNFISPRKVQDWADNVKLSNDSLVFFIPIILNHLRFC